MQRIINIATEFASQSTEFASGIPVGYIDKSVCGCGLTTVAIESKGNVIIAVPSKYLIANKVSQYPNQRCNYLLLGVDGEAGLHDVSDYVQSRIDSNAPCKILVTYDSLWKVQDLLNDDRFVQFPFRLIIDESNRLLSYASLKSSSKAVNQDTDASSRVFEIAYKHRNKVSFISATPTPLSYLPEWVSDLPQVKYTWSGTIKSKPYLLKRGYPFQALSKEIIAPLNLTDEVTVADIVARKVIVFINSVSQIIKICRENKLAKDDVAIVVADSSQNDARITGYNRLTNSSKLPKFTFITSSGFEGIDLYDEQAVSVVVSNTKKNHQMIDLLTDFKQATSRQRVKTNPNYGKFVFIYNQSAFDEEEGTLVKQLDYWRTMIQKSVDFSKKDKATYAFVSKDNQDLRAYTNIVNDEYVMNDNLFNADRYFILEVMKQYREGFDIRGAVEGYDVQDGETDVVDIPRDVTYNDIAKYAQEYISAKVKDFADSQRRPGNFVAYQSVEETPEMRKALFSMIDWGYLSTRREWIEVVGKTYIPLRKIWVTLTEANEAILALSNGTPDSLKALVHGKFNTGKCYTRAEVKKILNAAYLTLDIKRVAKHTDLYEYFECKETKTRGERQLDVIKRK